MRNILRLLSITLACLPPFLSRFFFNRIRHQIQTHLPPSFLSLQEMAHQYLSTVFRKSRFVPPERKALCQPHRCLYQVGAPLLTASLAASWAVIFIVLFIARLTVILGPFRIPSHHPGAVSPHVGKNHSVSYVKVLQLPP